MTVISNTSTNLVVTSSDASRVVITNPNQSIVKIGGQQGPPGADGANGGSGEKFAFSWGDASPATLLTLPANTLVKRVEIIILVGFDTVSSLSVGDSGNNSRLFASSNIDLSGVNTWESNPNYTYTTSTPVFLYLTPGSGNSTGNGVVFLYT